jgi:hypothetical protein
MFLPGIGSKSLSRFCFNKRPTSLISDNPNLLNVSLHIYFNYLYWFLTTCFILLFALTCFCCTYFVVSVVMIIKWWLEVAVVESKSEEGTEENHNNLHLKRTVSLPGFKQIIYLLITGLKLYSSQYRNIKFLLFLIFIV